MTHPNNTNGRTSAEVPAARWEPLGAIAPRSLADARLQLHHAAQIANSTGISLLPATPDDSHTNFEWLSSVRALATMVVPTARPFRTALRLADITLMILDEGGKPQAQLPLDGLTMGAGFDWLVARVAERGADAARMTMQKHYEIPQHTTSGGAPFALGDGAAFREVERYYANAALLLEDLVARTAGASPIRCWPHHFDLATLTALEPGKTIGAGMSPGDDSYAEPYIYVTPYPYPAVERLGPLPSGHWHTQDWVGAVLPASEIAHETDGEAQRTLATNFIAAADSQCRAVMSSPARR
ncbi:MAG: hypothetical protein M3081_17560 [Gemmatimonadota bacterium]|nr:hypothetical protein [Gemmatimonadota bacterium]